MFGSNLTQEHPEKGHRMPRWTTTSLREELIEEVRRLVKRTGRYLSARANCPDFVDETECCGASVVGVNEKIPLSLARDELAHIKAINAQAIIIVCPFWHMMFDTYQSRIERMFNETYNLPFLHYPQLLGFAMGLSPEELALKELRVSASKMVNQI